MRRYVIKIFGVVQGVGFRPFVYRLAEKNQVKGFIKNCGAYVLIDCEAESNDISSFLLSVVKNPPVLAKIEKVKVYRLQPCHYPQFSIIESSQSDEGFFYLPKDVATCSECICDIKNKASRYYAYPFTNCTNCGPRYSIIKDLPYDRIMTTMNDFMMCDDCKKAYYNPLMRRFHAEPISCPECGPTVVLYNKNNQLIKTSNPIEYTRNLIKKGYIIAIKGIGGFHLCCDATNDEVVKKLRKRKKRKTKPFAVMARSILDVKEIAYINQDEEEILCGKEKPILLVKEKKNEQLSSYVNPNLKQVGLFLPYTPLHYLLFDEDTKYIVLTSGNLNKFPIEYQNASATVNLNSIADYFLLHNRGIERPIDDSVCKVILKQKQNLRMGRGLVPLVLRVDHYKQILALGIDEKAGYAFSKNGFGTLHQYLGDLKLYACYESYKKSIENTVHLYELEIEYVVTDYNHHFLTTQYGLSLGKKHLSVYHHHAHMASCMGEFGLYDDVIGVIFDGTGLGSDETIWGGEFLVGNRKKFQRMGHLETVSIQGNEKAIEEIERIAFSYLYKFQLESPNHIQHKRKRVIDEALRNDINCFKTSSMGRLFDAVSYLLGLIKKVTYDGEAAILLEQFVDEIVDERYPYVLSIYQDIFQIKLKEIFTCILEDIDKEIDKAIIATKFHNTVIEMIVDGVKTISSLKGINQVVLSGGVFQNSYLLKMSYSKLSELGFEVYFNQEIPINDQGIAFGQLIVSSSWVGN